MSNGNRSESDRSVAVERRPGDKAQVNDEGVLEETLWAPLRFWWYPAVRARFGDRLEELAGVVLTEINGVGSMFAVMHLEFEFEGEKICIASSVDPETRQIGADVELASALEGQLEEVCVGTIPRELTERWIGGTDGESHESDEEEPDGSSTLH